MWRDRIPAGWKPIRKGADRRIACEIPVTFGDESAVRSLSEQSVLVREDSAVVVNNLMKADPVLGQLPPEVAPYSQLLSGVPGNEPRGVERFDWDPRTNTCHVAWSNPDVAIPNGIPTMSAATELIYGIGSRNGVWTLEGLDWDSGAVKLHRGDHRVPDEQQLLRRHHHRPRRNSLDRQLRRRHTLPTLRPEARGRLWPASGPSRGRDRNRAPGSRGRTAGHHRPTER